MKMWKKAASVVASGAVFAALAMAPTAADARPIQNPYSPAVGHSYRQGVVPTVARAAKMRTFAAAHPGAAAQLTFGGGVNGIGVTSSTPKVYLIFWGTQWGTAGTDTNGNTTFSADVKGGAPVLQNMFKGLGTGGEQWSGTMTQYCDGPLVPVGSTTCPVGAPKVGMPAGATLAGVWYDNTKAEPAAATFAQLSGEALAGAKHFGNNTATKNRYVQYLVLSAPGLNPDNYKTSGFCAWHYYKHTTKGDLAFTNMPYVMDVGASCGANFVNPSGPLDGYTMVLGHEYSETITDQNPAGGWTDSAGAENADKCAWISTGQGAAANISTATGSFAMQSTWSNDTARCDLTHVTVP